MKGHLVRQTFARNAWSMLILTLSKEHFLQRILSRTRTCTPQALVTSPGKSFQIGLSRNLRQLPKEIAVSCSKFAAPSWLAYNLLNVSHMITGIYHVPGRPVQIKVSGRELIFLYSNSELLKSSLLTKTSYVLEAEALPYK